jgi:hypothetical protein
MSTIEERLDALEARMAAAEAAIVTQPVVVPGGSFPDPMIHVDTVYACPPALRAELTAIFGVDPLDPAVTSDTIAQLQASGIVAKHEFDKITATSGLTLDYADHDPRLVAGCYGEAIDVNGSTSKLKAWPMWKAWYGVAEIRRSTPETYKYQGSKPEIVAHMLTTGASEVAGLSLQPPAAVAPGIQALEDIDEYLDLNTGTSDVTPGR